MFWLGVRSYFKLRNVSGLFFGTSFKTPFVPFLRVPYNSFYGSPISLLLIGSRFTLSLNLYVSLKHTTGFWCLAAMQATNDVPILATTAPLDSTEDGPMKTFVTF